MNKINYFISFLIIVFTFIFFGFYSDVFFAVKPAEIITDNIEKDYYDMRVELPKNSQKDFPDIFSYSSKIISDFDKQFEGLSKDDLKIMGFDDGRKWELFISTEIATSSKTASYIVKSYSYTGGAHGGTSIKVFNYDKNKKIITEDMLFSNPNWRNVISELAYKKFTESLGDYLNEDMLKAGLSPNKDNFNHFYLKGNDLVFLFDEYSIGPYVLGIQQFSVHKSDIKDLLSEKYK